MILGFLGFLVQMTRPDLAFAYAELSKFLSCPGQAHLEQAERCLAYLAGTMDHGITYSRQESGKLNIMEAWVDSDYATDPDTHRSVRIQDWPPSPTILTWSDPGTDEASPTRYSLATSYRSFLQRYV